MGELSEHMQDVVSFLWIQTFQHKWCWIFSWTSRFTGPESTAYHFLTWEIVTHERNSLSSSLLQTCNDFNFISSPLMQRNDRLCQVSVLKLHSGRNQCLREPFGILDGWVMAKITQSRGRRATVMCNLTSISDVWNWLPSSWTTPSSPCPGEYCPPHHPPCCLPHSLGLPCTSPFITAFLDLPLLSDLALSPNVLICKFHQMKNGVLLVHGLLLESSKSRSTESALKNTEWTLLFVDSWTVVASFVLVLLFQERTLSSPMSEMGQDSAPPPDALDWNSLGKDFMPDLPSKWHMICQRYCTISQHRTLD